MCYKYGITISEDALAYLSSNRFDHAVAEIETLEQQDVSETHFNELRHLLDQYYAHSDMTLDIKSLVRTSGNTGSPLVSCLKDLCERIIHFNNQGIEAHIITKC